MMWRVRQLVGDGRRRMDQALAGHVDDDRSLAGALPILVFERVEHLDLGVALEHQLTFLVLGPKLNLSEVSTALTEPIRDSTLADHRIARPDHLDEANAVASKLRPSCPVGNQLRQESHYQHAGRVHRS